MNWRPGAAAHTLVGVVLLAAAASGCSASRRPPTNRFGVLSCPSGVADALLSVEALQCWFPARHGQWRTVSHESHVDVLVVTVEADDLRDARDIAQRFVAGERATFSEILLYVQRDPRAKPNSIRRVRWTQATGFEAFDFSPGEDALEPLEPSE